VIVHQYTALDLDRVVEALDALDPIADFLEIVRGIAAEMERRGPG
jgi:uncharacterized protein YutE (UPF0331/DUF86 family)